MPCLLRNVTQELAKFILDLVEVQDIRSETGNIEPPEDFTLSSEKGMRMASRVASLVRFHKSSYS